MEDTMTKSKYYDRKSVAVKKKNKYKASIMPAWLLPIIEDAQFQLRNIAIYRDLLIYNLI